MLNNRYIRICYDTKTFRKSSRYEQELKNNDRHLKYKYEIEEK